MPSHEFAAFVGIDWGDQKHAICLRADGVEVECELSQKAAEIDAWASELRTRFGGRAVAVCLEQSRGPLIYALLKYEFLVLFPLNPLQATRYREALYPSGSKDDPLDARLQPFVPDPFLYGLRSIIVRRGIVVSHAITEVGSCCIRKSFSG